MSLIVLAGQLFMLLIVIAVGFFCTKRQILDTHIAERMTDFLMKVSIPCLLVSSIGTEPLADGSASLWYCGAIIGVYYMAGITGVWILLGKKKIPRSRRAVLTCMSVIPNTAFIGFPMVGLVLGTGATVYVGMMLMMFNIVFFTWAMFLFQGKTNLSIKALFTPCNCATIIMVILFLCNLQLNEYIYKLLQQFGSLTTPMALLIIGINLANADLKSILKKPILYVLSGVRLILFPALLMMAIWFFEIPDTLRLACLIGMGCPGSALAAVIVSKEKEDGLLASEAVVHSTMFSMVTIPVWIYIMQTVLE